MTDLCYTHRHMLRGAASLYLNVAYQARDMGTHSSATGLHVTAQLLHAPSASCPFQEVREHCSAGKPAPATASLLTCPGPLCIAPCLRERFQPCSINCGSWVCRCVNGSSDGSTDFLSRELIQGVQSFLSSTGCQVLLSGCAHTMMLLGRQVIVM